MADVFDAIARHASERPDACALLTPQETISYAQYETALRVVADNVRTCGIRPGAFTGIAAQSGLDYVLLLMGLMRAGAIACPRSPRWPLRGILDALQTLNATHLFLPSRIDAPGIEVRALSEVLASVPPLRGEQGECSRADTKAPCLCIFTSGSAGQPKAALHGCAALSYSAETANANMPLATGDRWLLSLPLFHVAGIGVLFRCALVGATVAIPAPAESIEDSILRCGVTHVSLVAT
ncbi:MAG: AMP-binding protein, partial [Candidatus Hydrogenedentes bacterium]|nr:AMP-binding protein [Candidatus Hydrogenedentota bacterium]